MSLNGMESWRFAEFGPPPVLRIEKSRFQNRAREH
jgi:hypothetical protein